MTLHATLLKTILLASAMGATTPPAQASDIQIRFGAGHSSYSDRGYQSAYAGELWIDGHATRIRSNRNVQQEIARAFRRAGYYARVSHGRVVVDFDGHHRPRVRWYAEGYSMGMRWGHDSVRLTINRRRSSGYYDPHYGGHHWNRRPHHPRPHWQRHHW